MATPVACGRDCTSWGIISSPILSRFLITYVFCTCTYANLTNVAIRFSQQQTEAFSYSTPQGLASSNTVASDMHKNSLFTFSAGCCTGNYRSQTLGGGINGAWHQSLASVLSIMANLQGRYQGLASGLRIRAGPVQQQWGGSMRTALWPRVVSRVMAWTLSGNASHSSRYVMTM